MTSTDELAPYPTRADDQTADALARHLTLTAYQLSLQLPRLLAEWEAAKLPRTGPLRDAYNNACLTISAQYGLILFLRREAGQPSEEPIIAEVYQPYEGWFEYVDSDLTEWLTGYGIDPDAVNATMAAIVGKADGQ
jgi:hypothetical protein